MGVIVLVAAVLGAGAGVPETHPVAEGGSSITCANVGQLLPAEPLALQLQQHLGK